MVRPPRREYSRPALGDETDSVTGRMPRSHFILWFGHHDQGCRWEHACSLGNHGHIVSLRLRTYRPRRRQPSRNTTCRIVGCITALRTTHECWMGECSIDRYFSPTRYRNRTEAKGHVAHVDLLNDAVLRAISVPILGSFADEVAHGGMQMGMGVRGGALGPTTPPRPGS